MSKLVLSRTSQESILVGEDIRITVIKVDGGTVKLLFDAPTNIRIMREELVRTPRMISGAIS